MFLWAGILVVGACLAAGTFNILVSLPERGDFPLWLFLSIALTFVLSCGMLMYGIIWVLRRVR
jgi:hypothetical protein